MKHLYTPHNHSAARHWKLHNIHFTRNCCLRQRYKRRYYNIETNFRCVAFGGQWSKYSPMSRKRSTLDHCKYRKVGKLTSFGALTLHPEQRLSRKLHLIITTIHTDKKSLYREDQNKQLQNRTICEWYIYSAGAAPPPGRIFSIFANSHSLLQSGHALRVFSHR
jgi:hypothetical protein